MDPKAPRTPEKTISKRTPKKSSTVPRRYPIAYDVSLSPIKRLDIPDEMKPNVPELVAEVQSIHDDFQKVGDSARNTPEQCEAIVQQLRTITERSSHVLKRCREINQTNSTIDRPKRKKITKEINALHGQLLRTRAKFTRSQKLLSDTLLVQSPGKLVFDAYMDQLFSQSQLSWPSGSPFKRTSFYDGTKRTGSTNSLFRQLLIRSYSDPEKASDDNTDPEIWCPIFGRWVDAQFMTAAHIVPQSLGTRDFAYLNGLGHDDDKIYELMFSAANGLMLHQSFEKALDDSQIVIVATEDDTDGTNYECRILLPDRLEGKPGLSYADETGLMVEVRWKDLDGKRLTWLNDNRPNPTNFYIRYICTRWARQRYEANGWELDREKIPRKRGWNGIGPLRGGVLRQWAYEVGDCLTPPGSRSTSGSSSVLEECGDTPLISESEADVQTDKDVAIRLANDLVNQDHIDVVDEE